MDTRSLAAAVGVRPATGFAVGVGRWSVVAAVGVRGAIGLGVDRSISGAVPVRGASALAVAGWSVVGEMPELRGVAP